VDESVRYLLYVTLLAVALPCLGATNLRILLTNDDGFESRGIVALHKKLTEAGHDVYLIAPASQKSGASASVSYRGVAVTTYPNQVWAVHGTPSDAVRVGLGNLMYNNPPDLVVSGANLGQNVGRDVNLSGTVGAAITALHLGVPAIALSVGLKIEEAGTGFPSTIGAFGGAARLLTRLISNMVLADMTAVLNINYPPLLPLDVRGIRWTKLSEHSILSKRYYLQKDGRYAPELRSPHPNARAYDAESVMDGFVTMTFLDGDMSVPTRRSQKYLDQHLLDRSFEPRYRPPTIVKTQQKPTSTPASTTTLAERKPLAPAIRLNDKDEATDIIDTPTDTVEIKVPEAEKTEAQQPKVDEPAAPEPSPPPQLQPDFVQAEITEFPAEQVADLKVEAATELQTPTPHPAREQKPGKKKPDSWLRRLFEPSSWRR